MGEGLRPPIPPLNFLGGRASPSPQTPHLNSLGGRLRPPPETHLNFMRGLAPQTPLRKPDRAGARPQLWAAMHIIRKVLMPVRTGRNHFRGEISEINVFVSRRVFEIPVL